MNRVAIAGAAGRMGRSLLEAVMQSDSDLRVTAASVPADDPALGVDIGTLIGAPATGVVTQSTLANSIADFDVLIDFTSPEASLEHLQLCKEHNKCVVMGTTGFTEEEKDMVRASAQSIPLVYAANMSVGVNVCLKLLEGAARAFGDDVDIEIIEAHHRFKKDAPSGTALRMGEVIADALDRDLQKVAVYGREGITGERDRKTIGFATIRAGDVIGEHTVVFAGLGERVEITHRASNRLTFASGAVRAANWIQQQQAGLYDMNDVLGYE